MYVCAKLNVICICNHPQNGLLSYELPLLTVESGNDKIVSHMNKLRILPFREEDAHWVLGPFSLPDKQDVESTHLNNNETYARVFRNCFTIQWEVLGDIGSQLGGFLLWNYFKLR